MDSASVAATGTVTRGPAMGTMERIKSFIVGGMDTDGVEKTNQVQRNWNSWKIIRVDIIIICKIIALISL